MVKNPFPMKCVGQADWNVWLEDGVMTKEKGGWSLVSDVPLFGISHLIYTNHSNKMCINTFCQSNTVA